MNLLRLLTYLPPMRKLARTFRVQKTLRRWYYHWARPPGGMLQLELGGIGARFYIRTPGELRVLESMGGGGGEQDILERLVSTLRAGDVVYDIGAHVGLYTVLLAKAVGERGQVIAFEPESQAYDHLQENIKLNGLTNVRPFRKALGDRVCEEKLYLGDVMGNSSLARPYTIQGGHEVVAVVEGDSFLAAEGLPPPRAVKIDVEGYEYFVIRGLCHTLARPACELVCCEIHPTLLPPEVKPEAVLTLLKSLGFGSIDLYHGKETYHAIGHKADAPGLQNDDSTL